MNKNMTQDTKTAISSAERELKEEQTQELKNQVKNALKNQYEKLEYNDQKRKRVEEERHVIEENIKNIKSGNLEAILERAKVVPQPDIEKIIKIIIDIQNNNWYRPPQQYYPNWWYNNTISGITFTTGGFNLGNGTSTHSIDKLITF